MSEHWRHAAVWAVIAAVLLHITINIMAERTLWHRLTALEHAVHVLQQQEKGGHDVPK